MAGSQSVVVWAVLWAVFIFALVMVVLWDHLIEWIMKRSAWRDPMKVRESGHWRRRSQ